MKNLIKRIIMGGFVIGATMSGVGIYKTLTEKPNPKNSLYITGGLTTMFGGLYIGSRLNNKYKIKELK